MATPVRVLIVEDRPDDAELMVLELRKAGFDPAARRAETEREFVAGLDDHPDLVLADFTLPGFNGLEALRLVQRRGLDVPFIFVSGTLGEDVAVAAMQEGAADYLLKDRLARLGSSVRQALSRKRLQQEKRQAEEAAGRLAAIIESSFDAIIATTPDGVIQSWNQAAERLYGYAAAEVVGRSVALLHAAHRRQTDAREDLAETLTRLRNGEDVPPFETVRVRKDGRRVDVSLSISPVRDRAGNVVGISSTARDVSQRKRAERFQAAEHATARILAESATLEEAAPRLLQTLSENLRWEVALLWAVDHPAGVLRRVDAWHSPRADVGRFEAASRQTVLKPGAGVAGRAWGSGRPVWVPDVAAGADGARAPAAERDGLHGAFGLPMRQGSRVAGVIEFYNAEIRQPDGPLLATLDSIASQVSQYIERRRSEAALRESELRFRQFAENVREVFWMMDARDGNILYANPAYEAVWGRSRQSLYDAPRSYLDAVHPEDRGRVAAAFDPRRMDGPTEQEYRLVRPDGSVRWIRDRCYPILGPGGAAERFVGIAEDVTERKEAEQAAFRLASIVLNSEDAIVSEDLEGRVTSWNPAAERLYGYSAGEILGRPVSVLAPAGDADAAPANLDRVRRGEPVAPHETVRVRKDGTHVDVWLSISPIRDDAGRVVGAAKISRDITEKKRVAETLARDALLLANVRDSVIVTDPDGVVTYWNEGATRLFDWTAREMLGRPLTDRVPEAARGATAALTREIAQGRDFVGEWHDYRKDGSRVWIDARVTVITDPAGRPVGLMGVAHDITDRKRAEAERDALLARLRMQIDRMPLGYVLFDADLRVVDWNASAERIFGYGKAEVLGMGPPFEKFLPPGARAHGQEILRRLRAGDMAAHSVNENRTKDGRTIVCQWYNTPLLDGDGTFAGLISLAQDVTAGRQAEAALRLRDRAVRAVTQGILITDPNQPDNPITYASPSFERMTGYAAGEVVGRNCRFLQGKDTDPDAVARVRRAVRDGQPCTVELLNYRKDGSAFWNELSVSPVLDEGGGLTHFVGVQTDVSERRRLEEQYRQAQKMEAIGQLAGGVAHDFNNLLTIISGYAELLLQKLPPGDAGRELAEEIYRAGERSASLTRQLLVFSRKQVVSPRVLDLNVVVSDAEKMLRRIIGEDVRLATVLSPGEVLVKADAGQTEQLLLNLAVNARDAMPQGGRLTIEVSGVELDEGYARVHAGPGAGRYALLAVSDTGSGMSPEVRARIFEPFFTTKEAGKGTGLGLAVVHGVAKQAGGHVEVYSEEGVGTTFKVYLPRVNQPARTGRSHSGVRIAPRGTETLLLVEDEDAVRALTRHVLQGCGYTVLEADGGEEALRLAARHGGTIHLLVTDVVMPAMSGRQLVERLLAVRPGTKVLYLSGYTDDAVVRHGVLEEQVQFLQKPFSPAALGFKVREVLDSP